MTTEPMTETQLLTLLKEQETDAASFYSSQLAHVQAEAMKRFHAEPYGDEIEGRSRVVTHDVEDTINWIMPKLMRTFMQADELIILDDPSTDNTQATICAAEYLKHVVFKDNDGEVIIHDYAFDALLQRIGVVRVTWEDPQPKPARLLEGVSAEVLAKYMSDPEYEILEQEQEEGDTQPDPMTGQVPLPSFSLKVQHTPAMGRVVIENIPPEEFAFSRRARSARTADYQRWKREVFLADLNRMYPGKLDTLTNDERSDVSSDGRLAARFPDEATDDDHNSSNSAGRRKVWLIEEELRVDYDADGITELRHVKRVGDVILENEEVERSEFHVWTPIRVAHRMAGRSLTDTLVDLAKIRTRILRNTLDSMSQSLVPRPVVNKQMADEETIAAILDADIGSPIMVNGNAGEALQWQVTPDVSGTGLQIMEYLDQKAEVATGVTRHAQGLRAEAITDTKGGIEALQSAANDRIELIARWLGKGLQEIFESVMHLLSSHQDGPRIIKIKGKPLPIDPRTWSDQMAVTISVGMTIENRQTQLANLGMIASAQKEFLMQAGPGNPVVGFPEIRHTLALMAERLGFRSADKFFKEIPEGWQPPPPGPDPKVVEAQGRLQIEQAKTQATMQAKGQELQMRAQEGQVQADLERWRAEQEMAIRMREQEADAALKARQQEFEAQLKLRQLEFEERMAERQAAHAMAISEKQADQAYQVAMKKASAKPKKKGTNGSSVQFGGAVG